MMMYSIPLCTILTKWPTPNGLQSAGTASPARKAATGSPRAGIDGCVTNTVRVKLWVSNFVLELGGNPEDGVDELTLLYRIARADPADLPFADGMHSFVAFDRSPRPFRRTKSLARRDSL